MADTPFLKKVVDEDAGLVSFKLANGLLIEAKLSALSEKMIRRYALHGISQKVGDTTSTLSKTSQYSTAFHAMTRVWDATVEGVWDRGGGGGNDTAEAMVRLKLAPDTDAAEQLITELQKAGTLEEITGHLDFKAMVKTLQSERANAAAKADGAKAVPLAELLAKAKTKPVTAPEPAKPKK